MPSVTSGFINRAHLDDVVAVAARQLSPEVLHVAYRIENDSTGEPSIFFRVLVLDSCVHEDTIIDLRERVVMTLFDTVQPLENWGLRPYFNFRSRSEQDHRRDPAWI